MANPKLLRPDLIERALDMTQGTCIHCFHARVKERPNIYYCVRYDQPTTAHESCSAYENDPNDDIKN